MTHDTSITRMRTTLDIDDDVLEVVRQRASEEGRTVGEVLSELARQTLTRPSYPAEGHRNGIPLLPARGTPVSVAMVDRIRDDEGV